MNLYFICVFRTCHDHFVLGLFTRHWPTHLTPCTGAFIPCPYRSVLDWIPSAALNTTSGAWESKLSTNLFILSLAAVSLLLAGLSGAANRFFAYGGGGGQTGSRLPCNTHTTRIAHSIAIRVLGHILVLLVVRVFPIK